jgi:Domain of unknown function (DUF4169)
MGEIVNLRRERKRAARHLAESEAAANRLLHGRSKADRVLETARQTKLRNELEQHRIDAGDKQ